MVNLYRQENLCAETEIILRLKRIIKKEMEIVQISRFRSVGKVVRRTAWPGLPQDQLVEGKVLG